MTAEVEKNKKELYQRYLKKKENDYKKYLEDANLERKKLAEEMVKVTTKAGRKYKRANTKPGEEKKEKHWKQLKARLKAKKKSASNSKDSNVATNNNGNNDDDDDDDEKKKKKDKPLEKLIRKKNAMEKFILNQPSDNDEKTKYRLEAYNLSKPIYESRTYNRLSWDKYIVTNRGLDREVNYIRNETYSGRGYYRARGEEEEEDKMLLLVGSAKMQKFIKGYQLLPINGLVKKCKNRRDIDVVLVDEHRTTMLCSICSQPLITSKSPHRSQYCPHCKVTFNRDINGGRNILQIGIIGLDPTKRDTFIKIFKNFLRSTKREDIQLIIFT